MLIFDVGPLSVDGTPSEEWEVLLNVNAAFQLKVDGFAVIDEPSFPVVELAKAFSTWKLGPLGFEYRSQESDTSPLILFPVERGFYVASPMSRTCADLIVDRDQTISAIKMFIEEVRKMLRPLGLEQYLPSC